MSSFVKTLLLVALLTLVFTPIVSAQFRGAGLDSGITLTTSSAVLQTNVEDELHQMADEAGVIFAGQVLAVRPHIDGSGSGWVEVEFRIDQAVRGCDGQATYILREWAGLWTGGVQRYAVGQRRLMLLHLPSASGLSSPVGGQDGAIPLMGAGAAPRPQDSFQTAPEQAVDVRWVEARLLRSPVATQSASSQRPSSPSLHGMVSTGRERAPVNTRKSMREVIEKGRHLIEIGPVAAGMESPMTVPLAGTASQGITLRSILNMLSAWQAEQTHAGH